MTLTSETPSRSGAGVRTYKARRSRVTPGQARALERWWPAYGLAVDGRTLDLVSLFGRDAPVVLEIGCGMGEATLEMAAAAPEQNLLAVDVHTPGLGSLMRGVASGGLTNVRAAFGDAVVLLRDMLPPGSLHGVCIFFPDPWPKARHAKRRLITPAFADLASSRLAAGGVLHVATDWPAYADQVRDVLGAHPDLTRVPAPWRPRTRFEAQGEAAGRPAHDVAAARG